MKSDYIKYRRIGKELTNRIIKTIARHELVMAAKSLNMVHKDIFVFDSEDETHVLFDRALFDIPRGQQNVIADFVANHSLGEFTKEERELLEGWSQAWFSLFRIEAVDRKKASVQLTDLIRKTGPLSLIDVNFSQTAPLGFLLATRLIPMRNWYMTTGVSYVFHPNHADELLNGLRRKSLSSRKRKSQMIPPSEYSRYFYLHSKRLGKHTVRFEDI